MKLDMLTYPFNHVLNRKQLCSFDTDLPLFSKDLIGKHFFYFVNCKEKVEKYRLSIAALYKLREKKGERQSVSTCEVTWESGTHAWSHSLVLQGLSKPGGFLHLVLQRLQSIHCLWGQWWFWKKFSEKVRKLWDCQTSWFNLEVKIQQ